MPVPFLQIYDPAKISNNKVFVIFVTRNLRFYGHWVPALHSRASHAVGVLEPPEFPIHIIQSKTSRAITGALKTVKHLGMM